PFYFPYLICSCNYLASGAMQKVLLFASELNESKMHPK
ncbi:hypothetical protein VCHENC02_0950, partial [Vibrio harveyi]